MRITKTELKPFFVKKTQFIKYIERTLKFKRRGRKTTQRHWTLDNGAPVLLVAHIDTVQKPRLDTCKTGAGFDDRLGCYLAVKLGTQYPEYFDVLLTDFEEIGRSTAQYFRPRGRAYNWIVGLDRAGNDFVDYDLASVEFKHLWHKSHIREALGSYSDIVCLDYFDCSKINLGIGVYNSHGKQSGFHPKKLKRAVYCLLTIARDYAFEYFKEPEYPEYYGTGAYGYCGRCGETYEDIDLIGYNHDVICLYCADILGVKRH